MRDNKFLIAVIIIIILVISILVVFVGKPQFSKYIVEKQNQANLELINAMINYVNNNGQFIVTDQNNETYVLIKYDG